MLALDRPLRIVVVVLALVAAACGSSEDRPLATVNGEDITVADVRVLRTAYQGDQVDTSTEQFRIDLTVLIFTAAIRDAAEETLGVTVTEGDIEIDEWLADPPERYAESFAFIAQNPDLSDELLRREAQSLLVRDRAVSELMRRETGYLEGIIDDTPEVVTAGCIRHILVETEAEAVAALDRLGAGEDFGALADEISIDTASQQGLLADASGCVLPMARWVPEFANAAATAPVGEVIGPVASSFGFHVIRVEEKVAPLREEFLADPVAYVDANTVGAFFAPWFTEEMRAADISVNILVGRWSAEDFGIDPPDA